MPLLRISEVKVEKLDPNLYRVWVELDNSRLIPTHSDQDVVNHINAPDLVTLQGPNVKVLSAGRVLDRFFRRVEPVDRRPERVEVPTVGGLEAVRVQFLVSGRGRFTIAVESVKGGHLESSQELPQ
jgi:hypothetical protein